MNKILLLIFMCVSFAFAKQHTTYFHAYVTHSEPVYEYRSIKYNNYDNYDESNYYRSDYNDSYSSNYNTNNSANSNTIGLDTVVGGTVGVILGNQIGRGNGRTAAKIVGGLLGASIANNTRHENTNYRQNNGYNNYNDNRYKKHKKRRKQKVLVGYKNYFVYKNTEFHKFSTHRKNRIRITETINF